MIEIEWFNIDISVLSLFWNISLFVWFDGFKWFHLSFQVDCGYGFFLLI